MNMSQENGRVDAVTGAIAKALGSIVGAVGRAYYNWRTKTRAEIELSWKTIPLYVAGVPSEYWRTIRLTVISSKGAEYIIAKGGIEARSMSGTKKWTEVCALQTLIRCPQTVDANRQWNHEIDGRSVANELPAELRQTETLELRVKIEDFHKGRVQTNVLSLTPAELSRKKLGRV
jgi:hypothetical protein